MWRGVRLRLKATRLAIPLALAVLAVTLQAPAPARAELPPEGMSAASLNQAFRSYGDTAGRWTGADSTVSVALPDGRLIWLFSDTFLGTVNEDGSRPQSSPFINNSMIVQEGTSLTSTRHGGTVSAPSSLVAAPANEMYWVNDAVVEGNTVRALYAHMRKTGAGSLDFELVGTALVTFALPSLAVTSVAELPLDDKVMWGVALLEDSGFTYIYGSEYTAEGMRFPRLARVPTGGLGGAWSFWTGTGWSATAADSAMLPLSGVGAAFAVQRIGGKYVLATMEGNLVFNSAAVAYVADFPTGPFSGPTYLFNAPEPAAGTSTIVYDLRIHPELATDGKLLVSYNVNSLAPDDVYADARLYRPRFIDVAWPLNQPDPGAVPAAPTAVAGTADAIGTAHLTWQAPAGSSLNYQVYQRDVTAGQTHSVRVGPASATTSADIGGLTTGRTYEFRVSATNAAGEGQQSAPVSVLVTIEPPPAPTNVTASAGSDGNVTVNWTGVPHAWLYKVHQRDVTAGQTEFNAANDNQPTDTTATIALLEHQHEYEFVVTAQHGGGESPFSASTRATATYARPAAPTGLTATAQDDGTIKLTWTATATNVYYLIRQRDKTAAETDFTTFPLPTLDTSLTATYLTNDHEYEYQVIATNQGGDSEPSNTATATARYPKPGAPSGLTAVPGDGQVTLTWAAGSNPDAWYLVYQRDKTAGEIEYTQLPLPITTCCTLAANYLINGHTYEFKVTATTQGGESAESNTVEATPRAPLPGAPTGLAAAAQLDGGVKLSWTAPAPGLYYWVYLRKVGQPAWTKAVWPTDKTEMVWGLLDHGTSYEFKVVAENGTGLGPASNVVTATVQYALPAAPTDLRARTAGDGSVDLDWDAPGPGLYYWIYMREVGQPAWTKSGLPTDKTEASWGYLAHGHTYEFQVSAQNQGGEGPRSASVTVTSYGGLPAAPTNLTATAGDGKATLHWTASATPNVYYLIYIKAPGQSWRELPLPLDTCCTFTATNLANGSTYEFKVAATNSAGKGATSNVASARPMPPMPQAPTGLSATAGDGKVTLHWTASSTSNVWYWIEVRARGGNWDRLDLPLTTCCTFIETYLVNGTTYDFRVMATNLSGDSGPTNVASARPMPPLPQAPTGLSATAGDGKVTLRWTASSTGNVWYLIDMRAKGGTWQPLKYPVTTCCEFTVSYLANGTIYEFRIRATNMTGNSGPSNMASAKPMPPFPKSPIWLSAWGTSNQVKLTWGASPTPNVWYWIESRNVSRGEYKWSRSPYPVTSGTTVTLRDAFYNGDVYEFRVLAYNESGEAPSQVRDAVPRRERVGSGYNPRRWMNVNNGANTFALAWILKNGISCQPDYLQMICFGFPPSLTGQPITIGDYFFFSGGDVVFNDHTKSFPATPDGLEDLLVAEAYRRLEVRGQVENQYWKYGPDLLYHEAIHSEQWDDHLFMVTYAKQYADESRESLRRTGSLACANRFEVEANLYWGGYKIFGPREGECG